MEMSESIKVEVVQGDALATKADVLALKYAQNFYGADGAVARRLMDIGVKDIQPSNGRFKITSSEDTVTAGDILFVGVPPLSSFEYREIREFSIKVLSTLAAERPLMRVLAITLHGPGYGLDERECFLSELAGITDAVASGDYPARLELVKMVELDARRAQRLRSLLDTYLPG
jgi:hypothetical protein